MFSLKSKHVYTYYIDVGQRFEAFSQNNRINLEKKNAGMNPSSPADVKRFSVYYLMQRDTFAETQKKNHSESLTDLGPHDAQ